MHYNMLRRSEKGKAKLTCFRDTFIMNKKKVVLLHITPTLWRKALSSCRLSKKQLFYRKYEFDRINSRR